MYPYNCDNTIIKICSKSSVSETVGAISIDIYGS